MEKVIFKKYIVYSDGKVWSIKRQMFLKPTVRKGYHYVSINRKSYHIGRLVGITFIPNPNNLPEIHHKNNNRSDNRIENLEWVTTRKNINYKYNNKYHNCHQDKNGKFLAIIYHNKKRNYLGYFNNIEDAHKKIEDFKKENNI